MKEDTKKGLVVLGGVLVLAGAVALAKKAPEENEQCEPGCPFDCRGYDRYDCVAKGKWELTGADSPDCGYVPGTETGRFQGFVVDEADNGVANAMLYLNGELVLRTASNGGFLTGSMNFGPYEIKILSEAYKEATFDVTLDLQLKELVLELELLDEMPGWPDDIDVTSIMVKPTVILGQDVDIGVLLWGPYPDVYPRSITGTITVDGATLTETIETSVRNPGMRFVYSPTVIGTLAVRAKNKAATFEVLPGEVGTLFSPFGCIRTELHALHLDVPAADPPHWTTTGDLVNHMAYTTHSVCETPGCYMVSWKDSLVRGSFTTLPDGTGYRCPHCGIWIKGFRHDYIAIMSQLLDHIKAAHPEFPLDKPPAGIVFYTTLYGRHQLLGGWLRTPGEYYIDQVYDGWDIGTVTIPDYGSVVRIYLDERRIVTETWEERL